jgi:hypothetical protein
MYRLYCIYIVYLIIPSTNNKRRKKRSLRVNNYLKTQNFGIVDVLQLYEILYLKILYEYLDQIFTRY